MRYGRSDKMFVVTESKSAIWSVYGLEGYIGLVIVVLERVLKISWMQRYCSFCLE